MRRLLILIICAILILCNAIPVYGETQESTYCISGYIKSETDTVPKSDFKVSVPDKSLSAITDIDGYFEINVPSSQIVSCLKISKQSYLSRIVTGFSSTSNFQISTKTNPVIMWVGDVSNDNVINLIDVMNIAKFFNTTSGSNDYNSKSDLNMDNGINISDIMLVANHFNVSSSSYDAINFSKLPVNLAKGKPITASSVGNGLYKPENAVDGIMETKWITLDASDVWLDLDLGDKYELNQIRLNWDIMPQNVSFEGSIDQKSWFMIFPSPYVFEKDQKCQIKTVARYVRVRAYNDFTSPSKVSLNEFEVYGNTFVDDYGDTKSEAKEIPFGVNVNCRFNYENDIDIFKFTPLEPGIYSIGTTGNNSTSGILCDEAGNIIANESSAGNFKFTISLSPNKTYFLSVSSRRINTNDNNYYLLVQKIGELKYISPSEVDSIAAGYNNTAVIKKNGTVVIYGDNTYRQCDVPSGLSGVKSIAFGSRHVLALKNDGTVAAWGENISGQCQVPYDLSGVKSIACGYLCSIAVKVDGSVIFWGKNAAGNEFYVPGGLNNIKSVSAGIFHTIALKEDQTLVSWGSSDSDKYDIPEGLSKVTSIAANRYHTIALKEDGTVAAWGGYIGWAPSGLSDIIAISTGVEHYAVLNKTGTVHVWGKNDYGNCNIPATLKNVKAIAAGDNHTVALMENGSIVAWGDNNKGQCDIKMDVTQ